MTQTEIAKCLASTIRVAVAHGAADPLPLVIGDIRAQIAEDTAVGIPTNFLRAMLAVAQCQLAERQATA
jgi:hypothetical protein